MQIKRQLQVELNQDSINEAIHQYLKSHNIETTVEDITNNIRYTNTRENGVRAVIDVTEELVLASTAAKVEDVSNTTIKEEPVLQEPVESTEPLEQQVMDDNPTQYDDVGLNALDEKVVEEPTSKPLFGL